MELICYIYKFLQKNSLKGVFEKKSKTYKILKNLHKQVHCVNSLHKKNHNFWSLSVIFRNYYKHHFSGRENPRPRGRQGISAPLRAEFAMCRFIDKSGLLGHWQCVSFYFWCARGTSFAIARQRRYFSQKLMQRSPIICTCQTTETLQTNHYGPRDSDS